MIIRCYSISNVTAVNLGGGLVGYLTNGYIGSCYYNSTKNKDKNAIAKKDGGIVEDVAGKTTDEMMKKSTYVYWVFDSNNWGMYADGCGYPYLATIRNYTLVTPTGSGSKSYDGIEVSPSLDYICSEYDANKPLTGSISFPSIKNAGKTTASIGSLTGLNYQLRFNNTISYTINKANRTITFTVIPDSP